jgi:GT2 family glycosyltransferase
MAVIAGVVVAVKEWSEEFEKKIQATYGNIIGIEQIDNSEASGICAKYNRAIERIVDYQAGIAKFDKRPISDYSWVIFAHDDAILKSQDINQALNDVHGKGADIVCVAGTTQIPPLDPGYWWKGLTEPGFRGSGAVIHRTPETEDMFHIESYGSYPQQVAAFDGLWFAVKLKALVENDKLRFDESYPGYHYYDVDFAATARSLGYQIWTADIQILHDKWGRGMEDPAFKEHQKIFVDKWSKKKHLYYQGAPSQGGNSFISGTGAFK